MVKGAKLFSEILRHEREATVGERSPCSFTSSIMLQMRNLVLRRPHKACRFAMANKEPLHTDHAIKGLSTWCGSR